jgi:hypothetical protein
VVAAVDVQDLAADVISLLSVMGPLVDRLVAAAENLSGPG